jgi:tetratricopeptide (TPR) repeat protein
MADSARLDELRRHFEENPRRYFAPLASALRRGGDAPAAAALARSQLAVYPGHLTGHVILGQALVDLGDAAGAQGAFARAAALDPGNVVALQQLLTLARDAGDGPGVRVWTERLYEADPELAAELAATEAGPDFEPLELEAFAGEERPAEARREAALDPRLAVDAAPEPAAVDVGDAAELGSHAGAGIAAEAPLDAFEPLVDPADASGPAWSDEPDVVDATGPEASPAPAAVDDYPPLDFDDAVVGLDLAPADPLPAPMREALPTLLEDGAEPPPAAERDDEDAATLYDRAVDAPPFVELAAAPADEPAVIPPPAAPFVTETMAALLAAQGHTAQAADVYARLLAQRPDDAGLRARLAALGAGAADREPGAATPAPDAVADHEPGAEPAAGLASDAEAAAVTPSAPDRAAAGASDAESVGVALAGVAEDRERSEAPSPAVPPADASHGFESGARAPAADAPAAPADDVRAEAPEAADFLGEHPATPEPTPAASPAAAPVDAGNLDATERGGAPAPVGEHGPESAPGPAAYTAAADERAAVERAADERAGRMWRAALAPVAAPVAPAALDAAEFDDLSFDHFFADAPPAAPAGEFERWAADADRAGAAREPAAPIGAAFAAPDLPGAPAPQPEASVPHAYHADDPAPAAPDDPDEDLAQFNAWLRGLAE